ncbi:hypothetical protein DW991_15755 [Bacteroides thetaiotaomicron]|nr:hypothetical protein DW991_15755 [Bacteroides thetaiotaomicron]
MKLFLILSSSINLQHFKGHKKGYLSQTANLFVNLKSNTMKNTLQRYGLSAYLQIIGAKQGIL